MRYVLDIKKCKFIGKGHEGRVYLTPEGFALKIFYKTKNAHDEVEILEKVKIEFGAGFFDWRGDFRRKEFGNHIFRFPKQRKKYEEIIIPYIKREIFESMDKHKKNGTKILVLDAPTLIENDLHKEVDYVILVWVDQNTQIQRVRARDGISREDAINRINSQMPLERKKDFANIIIENNDVLPKTKEQVDLLIEFLNSNLK